MYSINLGKNNQYWLMLFRNPLKIENIKNGKKYKNLIAIEFFFKTKF